jgi:hypothetical protein
MPVTAPLPQQPSPVEIQQFQTGRSNARQQYEAQLAQSNYGRTQAGLGNQQAVQAIQQQQAVGRRNFDDPFIARGVFNSGIRQQGLQDYYTGFNQQFGNQAQQYANQVGQYNLNDYLAAQQRDQSIQNVDAAEAARRADLAAQIKGIV